MTGTYLLLGTEETPRVMQVTAYLGPETCIALMGRAIEDARLIREAL